MRRNTLSLIKFAILCISTIALTAFLFKSFHSIQRISDDNGPNLPNAEHLFAHPSNVEFMGEKKKVAMKKIDWHDYSYMEYERNRVGIGEQGKPAHTMEEEERERIILFAQNGFNGLLSDKIALNRSVPDIRHKE